ncbi:hypothetical protein MHI24_16115 [Paenibacillus sp. FSL K6-1096]
MMSITPKISEAEWEIMKIIWEHHPLREKKSHGAGGCSGKQE